MKRKTRMATSPVIEIPFGTALKISLDNYYDLLKIQVGGLGADEYLQLKLVADSVDISDKKYAEHGYMWQSYYRLLRRSDRAIDPTPINGTVVTSGYDLTQIYGKFLLRLRQYVVRKNLSATDQQKIADLDTVLNSLKKQADDFAIQDRTRWHEVAAAMGYNETDSTAYIQWSAGHGHLRDIELTMRKIRDSEFDKKTILDREYPDPEDRLVVDAEFAYDDPAMRLRYPIHPDYEYPNGDQFNVVYLAGLPLGNSAIFEDRRVYTWDKDLSYIKTSGGGSFSATLDNNTSESKSIATEWGAQGNANYGLFSANVNASEQKEISEDFKKGTKVTLSAKASFKLEISYPSWFNSTLFHHKHVMENPHDFLEFFGNSGSLLYYPTHLIFVRGFSAEFTSSQDWQYDYKRRFSASSGGGFNVCGISFGASASYSSNEKQHSVDQSKTQLMIADDETTLRFVGYAVKKYTSHNNILSERLKNTLGAVTSERLSF